MHGVKRVLIFCIMTTLIPAALIITPLYLRNVAFADVTYPVAESDVLAIVDGISSIFCQSHTLTMNSTFNAYQMKGKPQLSSKRKHIRLKKSMTLPDDTLEYWGFYLLKGATVKLKVCSRYDGSRILVIRGEKNLKTCGLLNHNVQKYGAKMDREHNRVKVTFENAAEVIGFKDYNNGGEDFTETENVDQFVQQRIAKAKERLNKFNTTASATNTTEEKHHKKRHLKSRLSHANVHDNKLRDLLENDFKRKKDKRSVSNWDAHIRHGGNYNFSATEDASVSSFEMDLLTCYSGQILVTEAFPPSKECLNVQYLEHGNHMMTVHDVASNGYYYYIFYSDNDFVSNDIHAIFDIYKPTYGHANSSTECINRTECKFDISFFGDEITMVEVPTRDGIEHEEDDITYLISKCHPRMYVYVIFPIAVLFLILSCAFL